MKLRSWISIASVLFVATQCLPAQSDRVEDLRVGSVLVAAREAPDSSFAESVIALVRYGRDGAVGLMVNRRTDVPISKALKTVESAQDRGEPVFLGGPVSLSTVLSLLRSSTKVEDTTPVFGDVYLVASQALLDKTLQRGANPNEFRVYLGYCGWATGQLENEVRHKVWHIFNGNADMVFDPKPQTLWDRLIERTGAQIALAR